MVEESVVRLFDDQVDREFLTTIEDNGFARDLWNTVLDLGIDRVLASEQNDGMEGTWRDAYPHRTRDRYLRRTVANPRSDRQSLVTPTSRDSVARGHSRHPAGNP